MNDKNYSLSKFRFKLLELNEDLKIIRFRFLPGGIAGNQENIEGFIGAFDRTIERVAAAQTTITGNRAELIMTWHGEEVLQGEVFHPMGGLINRLFFETSRGNGKLI